VPARLVHRALYCRQLPLGRQQVDALRVEPRGPARRQRPPRPAHRSHHPRVPSLPRAHGLGQHPPVPRAAPRSAAPPLGQRGLPRPHAPERLAARAAGRRRRRQILPIQPPQGGRSPGRVPGDAPPAGPCRARASPRHPRRRGHHLRRVLPTWPSYRTGRDLVFGPHDAYISLQMRVTKTSGANLGPRVRLGATGGPLCPVGLMRSLYPSHPLSGPPDSPLLAHNGRLITKDHVVAALQSAVLALGRTDLRISGHSLRATCTSNLVTAGFLPGALDQARRAVDVRGLDVIRAPGPPRAPRARCARRPHRARGAPLPRPLTRLDASCLLSEALPLLRTSWGGPRFAGPGPARQLLAGFAHRWPTRCSFPNRALGRAYRETEPAARPRARLGGQSRLAAAELARATWSLEVSATLS
jgi:hypothetical protein